MVGKSKESESKGLNKTMKSLDKHMEMLASHYQPQKYILMAFVRGIFYGLGIIVSIAIVLPILLTVLSTIDWIPFIGDLISEIVIRMESAQRPF